MNLGVVDPHAQIILTVSKIALHDWRAKILLVVGKTVRLNFEVVRMELGLVVWIRNLSRGKLRLVLLLHEHLDSILQLRDHMLVVLEALLDLIDKTWAEVGVDGVLGLLGLCGVSCGVTKVIRANIPVLL